MTASSLNDDRMQTKLKLLNSDSASNDTQDPESADVSTAINAIFMAKDISLVLRINPRLSVLVNFFSVVSIVFKAVLRLCMLFAFVISRDNCFSNLRLIRCLFCIAVSLLSLQTFAALIIVLQITIWR